jgi:hypothetical protein
MIIDRALGPQVFETFVDLSVDVVLILSSEKHSNSSRRTSLIDHPRNVHFPMILTRVSFVHFSDRASQTSNKLKLAVGHGRTQLRIDHMAIQKPRFTIFR